MKRLFDIAMAAAGLVVSGPVLIALGAAVRLDSPGPALFRQQRIGRGKRPIRVTKLRTMVNDAERRGAQLTAAGDPRVTRVGAFLRRTKLDELPQLWDVLVGNMSLVGPRPEVERYVERYRPEWQRIFSVRPGVTDRASLVFRDEERLLSLARDRERAYTEVIMPMKVTLALESIERASLVEDIGVIVRTVGAIVGWQDHRAEAILAEAKRRIAELEANV